VLEGTEESASWLGENESLDESKRSGKRASSALSCALTFGFIEAKGKAYSSKMTSRDM
jgi:hypothetical protein